MSKTLFNRFSNLLAGICLSLLSVQCFAGSITLSFSGTPLSNETITLQANIVCFLTAPNPCGTVTWSSSEPTDTFSSNITLTSGIASASTSVTTMTLGAVPGVRTITANSSSEGITTLTLTALENTQAQQAAQQAAIVLGTTISTIKTGNSTVFARQNKLHQGFNTGIDLSALELNIDEEAISLADIKNWMASKSGGGAGDDSFLFGDKLGVFATGNFIFGDHDRTSRETGFNFNILGMVVGADYKLTDELFLGSAFQYAASDTGYDRSGGGLEADEYSLMLYSSYNHPMGFYLDSMLRYGWSDYRLDRNINLAGQREKAKADYEGDNYSASLNGGFEFIFGGLSLQPFARFEYIAVDIDGYREKAKSAGAINSLLVVNQQSQQSITTALGAQASYAISTQFGVILPTLSAEWIHEYKNNSRTIRARLINNASSTITSKTDNPDRNYLNLSAGISTVLTHGFSGFLNYEILLANQFLTQHTFNLGMRMEF